MHQRRNILLKNCYCYICWPVAKRYPTMATSTINDERINILWLLLLMDLCVWWYYVTAIQSQHTTQVLLCYMPTLLLQIDLLNNTDDNLIECSGNLFNKNNAFLLLMSVRCCWSWHDACWEKIFSPSFFFWEWFSCNFHLRSVSWDFFWGE